MTEFLVEQRIFAGFFWYTIRGIFGGKGFLA